jgi:geranylgeranyl diphosphate synthase type I
LPVNPSERFEAHFEEFVTSYRGSSVVSDMLLYHFGWGAHGPARRGKRLRPQMLMRSALDEGAYLDDALDAAVAIEILHNYSLVHDDIEDRDELRHGRKTLWSVYGIAQAINAGDAMCALSFLSLTRAASRLPAASVVAMVVALHEAHRTMCEGQSMDIAFESAAHVGLDDYIAMIDRKTAALFEAALVLGAYCGRAGESAIAAYRELGRAYGRAFQIRDDVLGIWASTDATGKVAGNDIARRKWTHPVVWALAQAPSAARSVVADAYARGTPIGPGDVARVIAALDELGAREAAMEAAAKAMAVLERHPKAALREYLLETLATPA